MAILARRIPLLFPLFLASIQPGCGERASDGAVETRLRPVAPPARSVTLTFAAFTTVREAYEKRIIPLFVDRWRREQGEEIEFVQSYGGSGKQAQAIVDGLEADIAALSHADDLDSLVQAGLVRHDWRGGPHGGVVSRSAVVIAVRKDNPYGIRDWDDLLRPGVRIVTPDPRTSGGGRWNVTAIYGAARRGYGEHAARSPAQAERFLAGILARVASWEADAQRSFMVFQDGLGDAALTSESVVMRSRMFGHDVDWVVPSSTLRMDNPIALVDVHADAHGVRKIAEAFIAYLTSEEAQRAFVLRGFRSVDPAMAVESGEPPRPEQDLWGIEVLGGWKKVAGELFQPGGVSDRARESAREE